MMDCILPKRGREDWRFEFCCVLDGGSLRLGVDRWADFVFLGVSLGGGAAFRLGRSAVARSVASRRLRSGQGWVPDTFLVVSS